MSLLEELGIPGPDHLREALTNCTNPLAAIEEFQIQNGILLPSLRPALPFVDLHDIKRLEFHESVLEELRERLLTRVVEIAHGNDKHRYKLLNELLAKSFPVINVKSLRPVVLGIMKHLPKIKQEYLQAVIDNPQLYNEAAVEVKQQIWQDNQSLFGDEVSPLLRRYIEEKDKLLFIHDDIVNTFFSSSPRARRQQEVIQTLVNMVGKNVKLYDMVLQFLRTLFLRTRSVHYCTLRSELLMALHDNDVHDICSVDPCHKFTWCLDACIRERFVDSKRAKELQGFLDGIRKGQEQILGDLSMILNDPNAINTLNLSLLKALQSCCSNETLPRTHEDLVILTRMLALGLGGWSMIDKQEFKEPKLEPSFITRFMPYVLSLMVGDTINQLSARLKPDFTPRQEALSDFAVTYSRDRTLATSVLAAYLNTSAENRDVHAVCRTLPALAHCDTDYVYHDVTLHCLISHLAAMADLFSSTELCTAVFDQFLLPYVSRESVARHILRLLWWVHHKLPAPVVKELMNILQPNEQHSESIHILHQAVKEKIDNYSPDVKPEEEEVDSPYMSVPAPTPAPHRM